jgi:thiamine kinase-like enzyme
VKPVDLLAAQPVTVVHGDYFTDNILCRRSAVYPVDWEWAALGVAEVDLACLVERWPEEFARPWETEYCQARWPAEPPSDFGQILHAVRLYLCFRYLAMAPDRIADPKRRWRLHLIRALSEQFGLL